MAKEIKTKKQKGSKRAQNPKNLVWQFGQSKETFGARFKDVKLKDQTGKANMDNDGRMGKIKICEKKVEQKMNNCVFVGLFKYRQDEAKTHFFYKVIFLFIL